MGSRTLDAAAKAILLLLATLVNLCHATGNETTGNATVPPNTTWAPSNIVVCSAETGNCAPPPPSDPPLSALYIALICIAAVLALLMGRALIDYFLPEPQTPRAGPADTPMTAQRATDNNLIVPANPLRNSSMVSMDTPLLRLVPEEFQDMKEDPMPLLMLPAAEALPSQSMASHDAVTAQFASSRVTLNGLLDTPLLRPQRSNSMATQGGERPVTILHTPHTSPFAAPMGVNDGSSTSTMHDPLVGNGSFAWTSPTYNDL